MATIRFERTHPSNLSPLKGTIYDTPETAAATFDEYTPKFLADIKPPIAERIDAFVKNNPTILTAKEFYLALNIWESLLAFEEVPKNIPQTFQVTNLTGISSVTIIWGKHNTSFYLHITESRAIKLPNSNPICIVNKDAQSIRDAITKSIEKHDFQDL